ncbi:hypothetical protein [Oharaeibacter diazotrophicus]|uniref:Uncharacterized protein n=2 Tax=Oharaeibacter diazotrophicus TaxID=1920512 RepID=A0A4R6RH56_9HYPH|nr:hypothetical protein [Oharaeibacter diazotrophicus]TDP85157.1 hypothetical protein EDD54_2005 [Oharaeibacter diazotrophicus]BBE74127.1 hypothetical protein OHA_1_03755 [Pleomorphomonas sp. SM30]GLS76185.1 hypothetical protein GCM10007904_15200 [Oharaeibacter diazotrophicus]
MGVYHLTEEHGAGMGVGVDATENVTVGTGASIVVAVAAAIALLLTVLVATLSTVVGASAAPTAVGTVPAVSELFTTVDAPSRPVAAAYRITDLAPPRDGTFAVVSRAADRDSVAPLVLGGLMVMTAAAAAATLRSLGAAVGAVPRARRSGTEHRRRG